MIWIAGSLVTCGIIAWAIASGDDMPDHAARLAARMKGRLRVRKIPGCPRDGEPLNPDEKTQMIAAAVAWKYPRKKEPVYGRHWFPVVSDDEEGPC